MISIEKFKAFLESNFATEEYSFSIDEDFEGADVFIKSKDPSQEFSIIIMPHLIGIGLSDPNLNIDLSAFENEFDDTDKAILFLLEHPLALTKSSNKFEF